MMKHKGVWLIGMYHNIVLTYRIIPWISGTYCMPGTCFLYKGNKHLHTLSLLTASRFLPSNSVRQCTVFSYLLLYSCYAENTYIGPSLNAFLISLIWSNCSGESPVVHIFTRCIGVLHLLIFGITFYYEIHFRW